MHRDRLTMLSLTAALIGVTSVELALLGARRVVRGLGMTRMTRMTRMTGMTRMLRSIRTAMLPGPADA